MSNNYYSQPNRRFNVDGPPQSYTQNRTRQYQNEQSRRDLWRNNRFSNSDRFSNMHRDDRAGYQGRNDQPNQNFERTNRGKNSDRFSNMHRDDRAGYQRRNDQPNRNFERTNQGKNRNRLENPKYEIIRRVQSQGGIRSNFILFENSHDTLQTILTNSATKMHATIKVDKSPEDETKYRFYINDEVVVEESYASLSIAKKSLPEIVVPKLRETCFTIMKKSDARDLPKVQLPEKDSSSAPKVSGIGAQLMAKMGWSGGGLGAKEQGKTELVEAHIQINRQGFGNKNISDEVKRVLKDYAASKDFNSIAFSPDFTKEERSVIHLVARHLNLRTKSYGKNEERFIVVENKIHPWDLIYVLIDAGGENDQFKLIKPTDF